MPSRRAASPAPSTPPPSRTSRQRLFLRADKSVPYGELMRVMNLLRGAGYLKVALVGLEGVDTETGTPDPRRPAAAVTCPARAVATR